MDEGQSGVSWVMDQITTPREYLLIVAFSLVVSGTGTLQSVRVEMSGNFSQREVNCRGDRQIDGVASITASATFGH